MSVQVRKTMAGAFATTTTTTNAAAANTTVAGEGAHP